MPQPDDVLPDHPPVPTGARPAADRVRDGSQPGVGDQIGEAAGGIAGVITGAALGAAGGPVGTIIGGIAGAMGGWWSGRAVSEAATRMLESDVDEDHRGEYEASVDRVADRGYADVRPAYQLGHLAGINPDYAGQSFDAVEHELARGWDAAGHARRGEWRTVRDYARDAFWRSRGNAARAEAINRPHIPRNS